MDNLKKTLEAAGCTLGDLVSATRFLTDVARAGRPQPRVGGVPGRAPADDDHGRGVAAGHACRTARSRSARSPSPTPDRRGSAGRAALAVAPSRQRARGASRQVLAPPSDDARLRRARRHGRPHGQAAPRRGPRGGRLQPHARQGRAAGRRRPAARELPARGRRGAPTSVFSMVTDTRRAPAPSRDGPDGVIAGLRRAPSWAEMSTVSPDVRAARRRVAARGASLLDAPVSGSPVTLEPGQLSFMVGGDPAALEHVRPYLSPSAPPSPTSASSGSP